MGPLDGFSTNNKINDLYMKMNALKFTALCAIAAALVGSPSTTLADDTNSAPTTAAPAGPAKFYGKITALDTNAMTFTVGEQIFTIVGETQMTKPDNSKATLADAVVGEPARGTYTKSNDGKLDVTKVRFGKKAGGKAGGKKKKTDDAAASDTKPAAGNSQ
jgi:hypothetical protein